MDFFICCVRSGLNIVIVFFVCCIRSQLMLHLTVAATKAGWWAGVRPWAWTSGRAKVLVGRRGRERGQIRCARGLGRVWSTSPMHVGVDEGDAGSCGWGWYRMCFFTSFLNRCRASARLCWWRASDGIQFHRTSRRAWPFKQPWFGSAFWKVFLLPKSRKSTKWVWNCFLRNNCFHIV